MTDSAFDVPRDRRICSFYAEEGYAEWEGMSQEGLRKLRTEADSQFFLQMAQFWGLQHAADLAEAYDWKVDYKAVSDRLRRQADEIDALAKKLAPAPTTETKRER